MLVDVLREQLQQAHEEKTRLLSLLEAEQQARRDLEQKLLPPPQPDLPPRRHRRLWLLLAILALAVAALVWTRTGAYWPLDG
jgi:ferric-dicitrate binding protein FerR (iron transport regulator)